MMRVRRQRVELSCVLTGSGMETVESIVWIDLNGWHGLRGSYFLYFYRKMDTPQRCQYCSLYFHPSDMDEHLNLHQHPTDLKPKTQGHGMHRMKYSNSAHVDVQDDSSDIALRSLMPDEIPQD